VAGQAEPPARVVQRSFLQSASVPHILLAGRWWSLSANEPDTSVTGNEYNRLLSSTLLLHSPVDEEISQLQSQLSAVT
jgi:hypothetical protein